MALGYMHSVHQCLSLHFERFAGKREMVVLGLAAFCHSAAIPLDLLADAAKVDMDEARRQFAEESPVLLSVLKDLGIQAE